jgi:hypothetical protein
MLSVDRLSLNRHARWHIPSIVLGDILRLLIPSMEPNKVATDEKGLS